MGQCTSLLKSPTSKPSKRGALKESWGNTRKGIKESLGYDAAAAPNQITPDNIFVPIQQENILPQIPIGRHHPVPRKGVEDDDKRTMHTNKFYANAFLGAQNMPVWTHPYHVWWGKGWLETGVLQSFGMNVGHVEEGDVTYGPGDPANVGLLIVCVKYLWKRAYAVLGLCQSSQAVTCSVGKGTR